MAKKPLPAVKYEIKVCEAKFGGPYNTQDVLVRGVNVPSVVFQGEEFHRAWSDRDYFRERWGNAHAAMKGDSAWHPGVESWAKRTTDEEFMAFLQSLADPKTIAQDGPVVGGRLVRYTNVSNGFECYAVDFFHSPEGMPSIKRRLLKDDGFGGRLSGKGRRMVMSNNGCEVTFAEDYKNGH